MKIARLSGILLGLAFVLSLAAASVAQAEAPLFSAASIGATFKANSLAGTLKAGTNIVACAKATAEGEIANAHLVGPFFVHFLECKSSENGTTFCAVNSSGAAAELILTKTLHGLLGLVLPSNLTGLLLLPTSGKLFVALAANACTKESLVTGTVAALVSNARNAPSLATLLTFIPKDITEIDTLNGLVEPELTAYSKTATLETVAHIAWSKDVEIM